MCTLCLKVKSVIYKIYIYSQLACTCAVDVLVRLLKCVCAVHQIPPAFLFVIVLFGPMMFI